MAPKLQGHNGVFNLPKHPEERVEVQSAECLREREGWGGGGGIAPSAAIGRAKKKKELRLGAKRGVEGLLSRAPPMTEADINTQTLR